MADPIITPAGLTLNPADVELTAVRAQGAGGQNVNKVATAIHLRFDIRAAALPDRVRARLLALGDRRISRDGVLVIKAQNHRTQERNRAEALRRLAELVDEAARPVKRRVPTRPGRGARERRLEGKRQRADVKKLRRKPDV